METHYRLSLRSSPDWSIVIQSEVGSGCGDPLPPHVSPHMEECPHVPPHMGLRTCVSAHGRCVSSCRRMWNDVYASLMSPHRECLRILVPPHIAVFLIRVFR